VIVAAQNIDDLHERLDRALFIHKQGGCSRRGAPPVGRRQSGTAARAQEGRPGCAIDGQLRAVWFGRMPLHLDAIHRVPAQCEVFVSIDSSGAIEPAASFVEAAPPRRHRGYEQ
jgi:NAD-dependent SIR2 family protein deacetylase